MASAGAVGPVESTALADDAAPASDIEGTDLGTDDDWTLDGGAGEPPARWRRYLLPAVLLVAIVTLFAVVLARPLQTLALVIAALEWLRSIGPAALAVVFGAQIFLLVCALPSWYVWVGAGAVFPLLFGPILGLVLALGTIGVAVWIGSVLAFLLGRFVLRPLISEWTAERLIFRAIDLAVQQRGLEVGFLLKLSPVMPLNVMNYVLAITSITAKHFVLTCPGSYLSMTVYVLVGASLSSLSALADVGGQGGEDEDGLDADTRQLMVCRLPSGVRWKGGGRRHSGTISPPPLPPSPTAWPLPVAGPLPCPRRS